MRYLKVAPRKKNFLTKNAYFQSINTYAYVDWATVVDDRWFIFCYFTFLDNNLVKWKKNRKQGVVAHSNTKLEFKDMNFGLYKALWLRF